MSKTAEDEGERIAFPFERLTALSAGGIASQVDVMSASLNQTVKHRNWLMARGRLDDGGAALLSERADHERERIRLTLDQMASASASPTPVPDAMVIAGRVFEDGAPRADLVVSALDRTGKALASATSNDAGGYRIAVDGKHEGEATLMVTSAKGRRMLVDDRVTTLTPGGVARIDLDIGQSRSGPDGPDRSDRPIMPDLVGHDLAEAAAQLKHADITIAAIKTVDRAGARGRVVSTEPPPGRLLGEPAEARLVVGRPEAGRWEPAMVRAMVTREAVDDGLPEEQVTGMFDTMAEKGAADVDAFAKAGAGSDRAFAALSGLKSAEAKVARAALARTLGMIGVDHDTAD